MSEFTPLTIKRSTAVVHVAGGYHALVNTEHWASVNRHKWSPIKGANTIYAFRPAIRQKDFYGPGFYMHQMILPSAARIDHRDHNGLNNRVSNLRPCNNGQNMANVGKRKSNRSGFKGVHWYEPGKCWRAQCQHKHVGYFPTAEDAARAYDAAARSAYGDFAQLNFPNVTSEVPV